MSAETQAALDEAISAHVADEYESMAGAWVLVTETTSLDEYEHDRTSWAIDARDKQSAIMTTGLLASAMNYAPNDDE